MTNEHPVPHPPKSPLSVEKKPFVLKPHLTERPFANLKTEFDKKETE